MNSIARKSIHINKGLVSSILIGVYFAMGWFSHVYLDSRYEESKVTKTKVGVGGGPEVESELKPKHIKGKGIDMLCIPLNSEQTEIKEI